VTKKKKFYNIVPRSEDSTLGSVISTGSSRGDVIHHTDTGSEASPKTSKKKLAGVASSGFFSKDRDSNKSQVSVSQNFLFSLFLVTVTLSHFFVAVCAVVS
jgi:hypothetical protein